MGIESVKVSFLCYNSGLLLLLPHNLNRMFSHLPLGLAFRVSPAPLLNRLRPASGSQPHRHALCGPVSGVAVS